MVLCQHEICAKCVLNLKDSYGDQFTCPVCRKAVNAADYSIARLLNEQVSKLTKLKKSSSNTRNALEALSGIDQSEIDQEMEIDQFNEHPQCFLTCRESGEVKTVWCGHHQTLHCESCNCGASSDKLMFFSKEEGHDDNVRSLKGATRKNVEETLLICK